MRDPPPAGNHRRDPLHYPFFSKVGAKRERTHHGVDIVSSGIDTDRAQPVEHLRADVSRLQLGDPEQLQTGLVELVGGVRHGDAICASRSLEPDHVVVKPEYGGPLRGVVGPNALEDTRSILQSVR